VAHILATSSQVIDPKPLSPSEHLIMYNVYIIHTTMAKAESVMAKDRHTDAPAPVRVKARKLTHGVPVKDLRAPVQVIKSTKEWLDQIIGEKQFKTYDEAIMFLITERQRHLPSGFGKYPDLPEYVCSGED
jgi:hypothetical protein